MSNNMKRRALAVAVIAALNALLIALAQTAYADLYKRGSSGQRVTEIQTRLKNWGYYDGAVDGVYGSRTESAVRWFQRQNGLSADGQAGPQTLAALGLPTGESGAPQDSGGDVYLLARLISAEASPMSGRWPSGRWCSTACAIPHFHRQSPASSIRPTPLPASATGSSTSPSPRAPTVPRRTRWEAGIPAAARSTISIPSPLPAAGSGRGR